MASRYLAGGEQEVSRVTGRGSFLVAAALKTPTINGYNAQGVNLTSRASILETPHSTNKTGVTNCYIQKTEEKHADRHENIDAMKWLTQADESRMPPGAVLSVFRHRFLVIWTQNCWERPQVKDVFFLNMASPYLAGSEQEVG